MAHIVPTVLHAPGSTFLGRVAVFATAPVIRFVQALRHRAQVRKLADFDDHMLKDIGLTRSDVDGALDESIFENPSVLLVRSFERRQHSGRLGEAGRSERPQVPFVQLASVQVSPVQVSPVQVSPVQVSPLKVARHA
ncbi:MAG: DUF1127 domain-containing protein [Microvirga sp.]